MKHERIILPGELTPYRRDQIELMVLRALAFVGWVVAAYAAGCLSVLP